VTRNTSLEFVKTHHAEYHRISINDKNENVSVSILGSIIETGKGMNRRRKMIFTNMTPTIKITNMSSKTNSIINDYIGKE
jgi:hypothetical protein